MTEFSKFNVYVDESGDAIWKAAEAYPLLCVNCCLFDKDHYLNVLVPKFNRQKFQYWGSDNIVFHERDLRESDKIKDSECRTVEI